MPPRVRCASNALPSEIETNDKYMKPIPFEGCNVEVAKDQPEYGTMPGLLFGDDNGTKLFCWQLTWRERIKILFTGKLWQFMLCFHQPQQPQHLTVDRPKLTEQ